MLTLVLRHWLNDDMAARFLQVNRLDKWAAVLQHCGFGQVLCLQRPQNCSLMSDSTAPCATLSVSSLSPITLFLCA